MEHVILPKKCHKCSKQLIFIGKDICWSKYLVPSARNVFAGSRLYVLNVFEALSRIRDNKKTCLHHETSNSSWP